MNCSRCRRRMQPGDRWCSFCGTPAPATESQIPHQPTAPLPPPLPDPVVEAPPREAVPPPQPPPAPPQPSQVVVQVPPASGSAVAALVFAFLGIFGPLFVIGPLLALGFGRRARREIVSSQGALGGWQLVRAARILAWTALIFLFIAIGLLAAFWAWALLAPDTFIVEDLFQGS